MKSIVYFTWIMTLFLLVNGRRNEPVDLDYDQRWETGYYPFPEMSRFLNSHSRIHQTSPQSSISILGYLCSIADNGEKIEEILKTFGRKYRSLITTIIEKDCANSNQPQRRTTTNANRKTFPRVFLRDIIGYND